MNEAKNIISPQAMHHLTNKRFCDIIQKKQKFDEGEKMRKAFMCSLCHNGILGGGLYIDESSITYKTNKLTVDKKYRNLVLPLCEICDLSWKRIVFPVATFRMTSGELYKFIIFNKRRFCKYYDEVKKF